VSVRAIPRLKIVGKPKLSTFPLVIVGLDPTIQKAAPKDA
jgi:predicted RNase H-like nuclease (RuvC/YqgF family)